MTPRTQSSRNSRPPGALLALTLAALLAAPALKPAPAHAASRGVAGPAEYVPVTLGKDGPADAGDLDRMIAGVKQEMGGRTAPIVVMVHGFATPESVARHDYGKAVRTLRESAASSALQPVVVGIYWQSDVGSIAAWMPQAAGSRIASLFGLKKAIRNPYLEKVELARRTGSSGLRSVLFRLQDAFPQSAVHLFAHSLGAEVVVAALSPETTDRGGRNAVVEQPARTLKVGMVVLAGADLDQNEFTGKSAAAVRPALHRARVWWVTVPMKNLADGVLELRRGAGRGEAMGNRGMELEQADLNALLGRRALVVDRGEVPAAHALPDYYNVKRLASLAASMLYLQDAAAPEAQGSILAQLDGIVRDGRTKAAGSSQDDASIRLYTAWRSQQGDLRSDVVRLAAHRDAERTRLATAATPSVPAIAGLVLIAAR